MTPDPRTSLSSLIDLDDDDVLDLDLMTSVLNCPLCKGELEDALMLPCQHSFCKRCLESRYLDFLDDYASGMPGSNSSPTPTRSKRNQTPRAWSCPTCRKAAAIPVGGVINYPECISSSRTRRLVSQLLMQTIISKVGKPRYFNNRDRSDVCCQTETSPLTSTAHTSSTLTPTGNFSQNDSKTTSCLENASKPTKSTQDAEIQTDDVFTSLDDLKSLTDNRSEPDGGSFDSQNVRETGVGENEECCFYQEWSVDSDDNEKPANLLFCDNGRQLMVADYNKKYVALLDLQTSDIIYRIENIRTKSLISYTTNEVLILDCIAKSYAVYDTSSGEHVYNLSDQIAYDRPGGCCIDSYGNTLIADRITGCICSYNSDGLLQLQYKTAPFVSSTPGHNSTQANCCVTSLKYNSAKARVACVESSNHRVVLYTEDGEVSQVIGGKGKQDGEFLWPTSCEFQVNELRDNLLVADSENLRICLFTFKDKDYYFMRIIIENLSLPPIGLSCFDSKIAVSSYNRPGKSRISIYDNENK